MSFSANDIKLTEWTTCGGCAAKWGATLLADFVKQMPIGFDSDLLVGLAPFDDAAVYQLTDDVALVSTTDFFPPLVDDPFDFGAIAAANACSDVFAMGGRVVLAVNIAAFPEHLPPDVIAAIFSAASEVVSAAGGTIAGGHTIRNPEPIFGLAVQGVVHPAQIFRKSGAQPGDCVVLSKPIGTGLVTTGGSTNFIADAIGGMKTLNRNTAEALTSRANHVHAVTDVTGYGLAGHGWEIADRSGVRLHIDTSLVPLYKGAREIADSGHRTGGDPRNRAYVADHLEVLADDSAVALCMDPQTSGGLLASVDPSIATFLEDHGFTVIGECEAGTASIVLS